MPELEVPFGIGVMGLQDGKNVPAPTPTGPQQQLDIWTPTPQQIPRVDLSGIGVGSMGIGVIPGVGDIRQPLIQQPIQPRPQVELPSFLQPQIGFQPIVPQIQAPIEPAIKQPDVWTPAPESPIEPVQTVRGAGSMINDDEIQINRSQNNNFDAVDAFVDSVKGTDQNTDAPNQLIQTHIDNLNKTKEDLADEVTISPASDFATKKNEESYQKSLLEEDSVRGERLRGELTRDSIKKTVEGGFSALGDFLGIPKQDGLPEAGKEFLTDSISNVVSLPLSFGNIDNFDEGVTYDPVPVESLRSYLGPIATNQAYARYAYVFKNIAVPLSDISLFGSVKNLLVKAPGFIAAKAPVLGEFAKSLLYKSTYEGAAAAVKQTARQVGTNVVGTAIEIGSKVSDLPAGDLLGLAKAGVRTFNALVPKLDRGLLGLTKGYSVTKNIGEAAYKVYKQGDLLPLDEYRNRLKIIPDVVPEGLSVEETVAFVNASSKAVMKSNWTATKVLQDPTIANVGKLFDRGTQFILSPLARSTAGVSLIENFVKPLVTKDIARSDVRTTFNEKYDQVYNEPTFQNIKAIVIDAKGALNNLKDPKEVSAWLNSTKEQLASVRLKVSSIDDFNQIYSDISHVPVTDSVLDGASAFAQYSDGVYGNLNVFNRIASRYFENLGDKNRVIVNGALANIQQAQEETKPQATNAIPQTNQQDLTGEVKKAPTNDIEILGSFKVDNRTPKEIKELYAKVDNLSQGGYFDLIKNDKEALGYFNKGLTKDGKNHIAMEVQGVVTNYISSMQQTYQDASLIANVILAHDPDNEKVKEWNKQRQAFADEIQKTSYNIVKEKFDFNKVAELQDKNIGKINGVDIVEYLRTEKERIGLGSDTVGVSLQSVLGYSMGKISNVVSSTLDYAFNLPINSVAALNTDSTMEKMAYSLYNNAGEGAAFLGAVGVTNKLLGIAQKGKIPTRVGVGQYSAEIPGIKKLNELTSGKLGNTVLPIVKNVAEELYSLGVGQLYTNDLGNSFNFYSTLGLSLGLGSMDGYNEYMNYGMTTLSEISSPKFIEATRQQTFGYAPSRQVPMQYKIIQDSVDYFVQMNKSDPRATKQMALNSFLATTLKDAANISTNEVLTNIQTQIDAGIFDPNGAIDEPTFQNMQEAKARGINYKTVAFTPVQSFLENKAYPAAETYRASKINRILPSGKTINVVEQMKDMVEDSGKSFSDVMEVIRKGPTYRNGVKVIPSVDTPTYDKKPVINFFPEKADGETIKYDGYDEIMYGIDEALQLGKNTKYFYRKVLSNPAYYDWKPSKVGRFTIPGWIVGSKTPGKLNQKGRDFINGLALVGNEFDSVMFDNQQGSYNVVVEAQEMFDQETEGFETTVEAVDIPTDSKGNLVSAVNIAKNVENGDPIRHSDGVIFYVTGDLVLDTLIFQMNHALNYYQNLYTKDGNLKTEKVKRLYGNKSLGFTPGGYANPSYYIGLITKLYPDRNWKNYIYEVVRTPAGSPVTAQYDGFWRFSIVRDSVGQKDQTVIDKQNELLNKIYNTERFAYKYEASLKNYQDALEEYTDLFAGDEEAMAYVRGLTKKPFLVDGVAAKLSKMFFDFYDGNTNVDQEILYNMYKNGTLEKIIMFMKKSDYQQEDRTVKARRSVYQRAIDIANSILLNKKSNIVELLNLQEDGEVPYNNIVNYVKRKYIYNYNRVVGSTETLNERLLRIGLNRIRGFFYPSTGDVLADTLDDVKERLPQIEGIKAKAEYLIAIIQKGVGPEIKNYAMAKLMTLDMPEEIGELVYAGSVQNYNLNEIVGSDMRIDVVNNKQAMNSFRDIVIKRLKQSGAQILELSQEDFNAKIKELDPKQIFGDKNSPKGFLYNGEIYLNSSKFTAETVLHEAMGHLYMDWLKSNRRNDRENGVRLIKEEGQIYIDYVKEIYEGLDEEQIIDEALAQAIGDGGTRLAKRQATEQRRQNRFINWIVGVFNTISKNLGIDLSNPNMTLGDFITEVNRRGLAGDLGEFYFQTDPNFDVVYQMDKKDIDEIQSVDVSEGLYKNIKDFEKETVEKYGSDNLLLSLSEENGKMKLKVIMSYEQGKGTGTKAMNDIIEYADKQGIDITLSPVEDFGGNFDRLKEFYSRFGFAPVSEQEKIIENIRDSYIRRAAIRDIGPEIKITGTTRKAQLEKELIKWGKHPDNAVSDKLKSLLNINNVPFSDDDYLLLARAASNELRIPAIKSGPIYTKNPYQNQNINNYVLEKAYERFGKKFSSISKLHSFIISEKSGVETIQQINKVWSDLSKGSELSIPVAGNEGVLFYGKGEKWTKQKGGVYKDGVKIDEPFIKKGKLLVYKLASTDAFLSTSKLHISNSGEVYIDPVDNVSGLSPLSGNNDMETAKNQYDFFKALVEVFPRNYKKFNPLFVSVINDTDSSIGQLEVATAAQDYDNRTQMVSVEFDNNQATDYPDIYLLGEPEAYQFVLDQLGNTNEDKALAVYISSEISNNTSPKDVLVAINDAIKDYNSENGYDPIKMTAEEKMDLARRISLGSIINQRYLDGLKNVVDNLPEEDRALLMDDIEKFAPDLTDYLISDQIEKETKEAQIDPNTKKEVDDIQDSIERGQKKIDETLDPTNTEGDWFKNLRIVDIMNSLPKLKQFMSLMETRLQNGKIINNGEFTPIKFLMNKIYYRFFNSNNRTAYLTQLNQGIVNIYEGKELANTQINNDATTLVRILEYITNTNGLDRTNISPEIIGALEGIIPLILTKGISNNQLQGLSQFIGSTRRGLQFIGLMNGPANKRIMANFDEVFGNTGAVSEKAKRHLISHLGFESKSFDERSFWKRTIDAGRNTFLDLANPVIKRVKNKKGETIGLGLGLPNKKQIARAGALSMVIGFGTNPAIVSALIAYQGYSYALKYAQAKKYRNLPNSTVDRILNDIGFSEQQGVLANFLSDLEAGKFAESKVVSGLATGAQNVVLDQGYIRPYLRIALEKVLRKKGMNNEAGVDQIYQEHSSKGHLDAEASTKLRLEVEQQFLEDMGVPLYSQDGIARLGLWFTMINFLGNRGTGYVIQGAKTMQSDIFRMRHVQAVENGQDPTSIDNYNRNNYEIGLSMRMAFYSLLRAMRFMRFTNQDSEDARSYIKNLLSFMSLSSVSANAWNASAFLRLLTGLVRDTVDTTIMINDKKQDLLDGTDLNRAGDYVGYGYPIYNAVNEMFRGIRRNFWLDETAIKAATEAVKQGDLDEFSKVFYDNYDYRRNAYNNYLVNDIANKYGLATPIRKDDRFTTLFGIQTNPFKENDFDADKIKNYYMNTLTTQDMMNRGLRNTPVLSRFAPAIDATVDKIQGKEIKKNYRPEDYVEAIFAMDQITGVQELKMGVVPADLTERDAENLFANLTKWKITGSTKYPTYVEGERQFFDKDYQALIEGEMGRTLGKGQRDTIKAAMSASQGATEYKTNVKELMLETMARLSAKEGVYGNKAFFLSQVSVWAENMYAQNYLGVTSSNKKYYEDPKATGFIRGMVVKDLYRYLPDADAKAAADSVNFYGRERLPEYQGMFNSMVDKETGKPQLYRQSEFSSPLVENIFFWNAATNYAFNVEGDDAAPFINTALQLKAYPFSYDEDPKTMEKKQKFNDARKLSKIIHLDSMLKNSPFTTMQQLAIMTPIIASNPREFNSILNDPEAQTLLGEDRTNRIKEILLSTDSEIAGVEGALADLSEKFSKADYSSVHNSSGFYSQNPPSDYNKWKGSASKVSSLVKSNLSKLSMKNGSRNSLDTRARYTPEQWQIMNRRIKYLAANTEEFTKPSKSAKGKKSASTINRGRSSGRRARIKGPSQTSRKNSNKV